MNNYSKNVFINCPFDEQYKNLFNAIVFTIHDAGLYARCTLELTDSSQNRIDKIYKIIQECKFGINDICRIEIDNRNKFPRFNMPFELGLFIGCKKFGVKKQKQKSCLILDKKPYRYQKFISDISGFDIFSHNNKYQDIISCVRNWLQTQSGLRLMPSPRTIMRRYINFQKSIIKIRENLQRNKSQEFTFVDFQNLVIVWLKSNEYKKIL